MGKNGKNSKNSTIRLKNDSFTDFQLLTIFAEVESIVNSRPLTPASDDVNDYEPLTPNHFLVGRCNPNLPIGIFGKTDMTSRKRWRQVQVTADHFWQRFRMEYLPRLTPRQIWREENNNLKVGDMVLLTDRNIPSGEWPLARITKCFPGDDNMVRVVEIKTRSGTYVRPIVKLCLLEEQ